MLKRKSFYVLSIVIGIALIGISFLLTNDDVKSTSGICIGLGAGLVGMGFAIAQRQSPQILRHG